jgi:hypothetical protein
MADAPGEVSLLLAEMRSGRKDALTKLAPLVYNELRRLKRAREKLGFKLPNE